MRVSEVAEFHPRGLLMGVFWGLLMTGAFAVSVALACLALWSV